ncbi:MAG: phosphoribosylformylglycinamidine synthase subunit PurL [Candidatus Altiarchaeota archaeon]
MSVTYEKLADDIDVFELDILSCPAEELEKLSIDRSLALSKDEIVQIRDYFKKEKRNPTDIELEAFAQSWSEHCCYKSSKPVLKDTVFSIKAPQNICVISEDAGVVDFDEDHAYVLALESHNHPSALDPYGGAATGIGGILRDVICMGAQPIALVDPLFFGPLDYPEKKLPEGTKHPRYLFDGVVAGIAAYGNRVGIPTVGGMVAFDESYLTNCLVNVGCLGILDKKLLVHSRVGAVGDVYILAGGKTGRDGIHGVTFASAELHAESEESDMPAVQLGYAIMKEPLMHACLEANEKGLLTGMKDFGGGGLSCVSAEMAYAAGLGGVIEVDKIPLKEEGISPWEIWVSESQERMMLSVSPKNVDAVLEIFDFWDVPACVVGKVEESNKIRATWKGKQILCLDLEFLISGVQYERPMKYVSRDESDPEFEMPDLVEAIMKVLSSSNIGSRESIIRRYDHQVRAQTVISPMQGVINKQTHGDAAILKPLKDSFKGLAITSDINPKMCAQDPYWGSASAVEEVVRNLTSVGARPHSLADNLNFGNPEKPDRMADLAKACEGLTYVARSLGLPFVSGNVSLYNEGVTGPIAPTPTVLGVGIIEDVRKAVTSDAKNAGNLIYLVGETKKELGGSEYYAQLGLSGGKVPRVELELLKTKVEGLLDLMDVGYIQSCHDISGGGLAVALAEMCFGGDLGAGIELNGLGDLRTDYKLFSESNGRWLIEVDPKNEKVVEKKLSPTLIGKFSSDKRIKIQDGMLTLDLSLTELRGEWEGSLTSELDK